MCWWLFAPYQTLNLLFNRSRRFRTPQVAIKIVSQTCVLYDADNDSFPDAAVACNYSVTIMHGLGNGAFAPAGPADFYNLGERSRALSYGNVNDDGRPRISLLPAQARRSMVMPVRGLKYCFVGTLVTRHPSPFWAYRRMTNVLPSEISMAMEIRILLSARIPANPKIPISRSSRIRRWHSPPHLRRKCVCHEASLQIYQAAGYWLCVGSAAGAADICSAAQGLAHSRSVAVPVDGRKLYVTLYTQIKGAWKPMYASLDAFAAQAVMTSQAPGSQLAGNATFAWAAGIGASEYWLTVGSSVNGVWLNRSYSYTTFAMPLPPLPPSI